MNTEFEAKFLDIDEKSFKKILNKIGAHLVREKYTQKRINFHLPPEKKSNNAWLRIRDEGNKITLALKVIEGEVISNQKELELTINNFDDAVSLLQLIGCEKKGLQESKRELWRLFDTEITIDEWPFLEPFVEIEGVSENRVKEVAHKLGFDFSKAIFGAVGKVYKIRYGVSLDEIEKAVGDIKFNNKKMKVFIDQLPKH